MGDSLTLSVVTPSFNTGRYLGAAIASVLEQDWPHIQHIVMDGGSTDNSLDVLREFGDRVRWISQKDQGQSDAINKGFSRTSGDVLAWLNSDDTYAPGAVRSSMEFLQANPDVAMVYGNADYIDAAGKLIAPCAHIEPFDRHRLFYYSDFIVQPAAFFRRSAFDAVGGLDPSLNWTMDYDLWIKIAKRFKIAYLPKLMAHYRWLADNKTAIGGFARIDEISSVLARHGLPMPAYVRLERVNLYLQQLRQSLRQGRLGSALGSLGRATGTLCASRRAMISMFQPRTWRIIWTGQVLRARAVENSSVGSAKHDCG